MGQKVSALANRLLVNPNFTWSSQWYCDTDKEYIENIVQDDQIRTYIRKKYHNSLISSVIIERFGKKKVKITIEAARPGSIMGKKGEDMAILKANIEKMTGIEVSVGVNEVKKQEIDPILVAQTIAKGIEGRNAVKRLMKKASQSAMKMGALGIRIVASGRIAGADIARSETLREGRMPLHTWRADVRYGFAEAHTTYGVIGVKVWIFKR